jgi:hypothetical protein
LGASLVAADTSSMRLRLTLLALVTAAIAVPAAGAEGPPPPPKDRPAPTTFPADAAARIAAEVCARVQVENCVQQATALAEAALEGCRSARAPAMCVKEAVVRGLRAAASGEEAESEETEDSDDLATTMCTNAKTRFPVRFAAHFDSVDACVAALNEALDACPTEAAARGCLQAALRKALAGAEGKREKTQSLARTIERMLCRTAEQHGRRCGPAIRARARAIAARCATAADPKACVREALKPKAGRK